MSLKIFFDITLQFFLNIFPKHKTHFTPYISLFTSKSACYYNNRVYHKIRTIINNMNATKPAEPFGGNLNDNMVEYSGFEPLTSSLPAKRSSQMS